LAGPDAVARPLALLERLGPGDPPIISWSTVTAPVLVVGRGVRPGDIDAAWCAHNGIPVLQRRSGGGPVLWDRDLLGLDVVVPPGHPLAEHDVTRAYAWLGAAVASGLTALGAPVASVPLAEARRLQARQDPVSRAAVRACFGGVSPFEVLAPDLRKCVGLAQARRAAGTLFQCGIALGFDADALAHALGRDDAAIAMLRRALGERVVGLTDLVPGVTAAAVVGAVEDALTRAVGVALTPDDMRPDERGAQSRLAATLAAPDPASSEDSTDAPIT
jgi:lipoate-protein ligase A